jgi:hypothetical protein
MWVFIGAPSNLNHWATTMDASLSERGSPEAVNAAMPRRRQIPVHFKEHPRTRRTPFAEEHVNAAIAYTVPPLYRLSEV